MPTTTSSITNTEDQDKIWKALHDTPKSTTSELALLAGVSKPDAAKILAVMEKQGRVTHPVSITGRGSSSHRWVIRQSSTADTSTASEPAAVPTAPGGGETVPAPVKLAPGQLQQLVLAHLRTHPGKDISPTQIHKALMRSSGAISNALERMVATGIVTRTQDKPKRYRAI